MVDTHLDRPIRPEYQEAGGGPPAGQEYHLSDAVAEAQGAISSQGLSSRHGRITKIGIVRIQDGKPVKLVFNLDKYMSKGDMTQNPVIQDKDLIYVPMNDDVGFSTVLTALAAGASIYFDFARN